MTLTRIHSVTSEITFWTR